MTTGISTLLTDLHPALKHLKKSLLPVNLIRTLWAFATNPAGLLWRAEHSKSDSESAPIPFYVACVSFAILLFSILGQKQGETSWQRAFGELSKNSAARFAHYFNITEDEKKLEWMSQKLPLQVTVDSSRRIEYLVGSLDAAKVSIYLRDNGEIALSDEVFTAASHAKARDSREGKIALLLLPLILATVTFIPHLILKAKSHTSVAAALFYWQGFWVVVLAFVYALESHWIGSFASDRSLLRAAGLSFCVANVMLAHLFVILFITTSASVARILCAGIAWIVAPLPIILIIELIFAGVNRLV